MSVSPAEIEARWLVAGNVVAGGNEALVETFSRVEAILGRPWLEARFAGPARDPATVLSIHATGQHLQALERAGSREKLIERVRTMDPAALCELHALALCAMGDPNAEVEIEPTIQVEGGQRVPDFAVRQPGELWTYVEVAAANDSEDPVDVQTVTTALAGSLPPVGSGVVARVRFRDAPTDQDIAEVGAELTKASVGTVVDRPRFVLEVGEANAVSSISESDEQDRPIYGARTRDEERSLEVHVPYTDERAQSILDTGAKQLPEGGPGLICVRTAHGRYWRGLVERSFLPTVRRGISGALLFFAGMVPGDDGSPQLRTVGRALPNEHARAPLPSWLLDRLTGLPARFR
jgi:hypothetical protein